MCKAAEGNLSKCNVIQEVLEKLNGFTVSESQLRRFLANKCFRWTNWPQHQTVLGLLMSIIQKTWPEAKVGLTYQRFPGTRKMRILQLGKVFRQNW